MKLLKKAIQTKEGIIGFILIAAGIIVACVGAYLFQGTKLRDFVPIAGSIISLIGTQSISRLIIEMRDKEK